LNVFRARMKDVKKTSKYKSRPGLVAFLE
jgi:hypothetical protein